MSYHPRIETRELASFQTTRTRNSELWFINNERLEDAILGYTAKFAERYGVKLYALSIEGTHIHTPAHFPLNNRASFMRDTNSCVARALPRFAPTYPGGRLFERRYSNEFLPNHDDIEHYFFYTVLQPIQDGLVDLISEYPFYNCFHDAVYGIERKYKVIRWGEYHAAKRHNPEIRLLDYTDFVTLKYERLPGYEHLSQAEYAKLMYQKLEMHRLAAIEARGYPCLGREKLLQIVPGTRAKNPKVSTRHSHRPRVLSLCPTTRARCKAWYFQIYFEYREASKRYRSGERDVEFPSGTYRPHLPPDQPAVFE